MERELWQRAEELFHAALERSPEDRRAFLDEACGEETGLRRQVETLVSKDELAGSFLEKPVLSDITAAQRGQRVFDVILEGGAIGLQDFDVFNEAGGNRSAVVRDVYVLVGDGVLDIELVPVAGLPPMIAAIEVIEGGAPPASPKLSRR